MREKEDEGLGGGGRGTQKEIVDRGGGEVSFHPIALICWNFEYVTVKG